MLLPAGLALGDALAEVSINPLVCSLRPERDGEWTANPNAAEVRNNLVEQVSKPVAAPCALCRPRVTKWLEVGSGKTLAGPVKRFDRVLMSPALRRKGGRPEQVHIRTFGAR